MLVGLDDTDSLEGGCTTYLAALIIDELSLDVVPNLIRLNPNIPYKTRGNGAVSFHTPDDPETRKKILKLVEKHSHLKDENTNPGVVFLPDIDKQTILKDFYNKAVSEHVTVDEAESAAKKSGAELHKYNNGRGIIGALAAVGADLSTDRTIELLAYRMKENYGQEKEIDKESVYGMNKELFPQVFHSIDSETNKILITPQGYDPVFCGIRGESLEAVEKAWSMIYPLEKIERTQVFWTNQATDAHLRQKKVSEIKPFDCVTVEGLVAKEPTTKEGGHVFFGLEDNTGYIDCAAYEPTGGFRDAVRKLVLSDLVRASGGVSKYPNTVNLERLEILELKENTVLEAPVCCSRRMTSAGKGKGFKCKKCGRRAGQDEAVMKEKPRELSTGLFMPPERAQRHLSKPLHRIKKQY